MILRSMLQRLYASLTGGPGLNARPHRSRQRVDLLDLRHLAGTDPGALLGRLLNHPDKPVEFPARVPLFDWPDRPESEWTDPEKNAGAEYHRQCKLLAKLRDIAEDTTDYYNDHGEHSLFIGFPLLSLPPSVDSQGNRSNRVLAPLALVPINVRVRRAAGAGITVETAGDRADLVQPNPALLAWVEQQTGVSTEDLFADETGEEPWREIAELVTLVTRAARLPAEFVFSSETTLEPVPRADELPAQPALLPGAVLGLFPLGNPGLLRDTQWMIDTEPSLRNPVKAFLSPQALVEPAEPAPAAAAEPDPRPARNFADELHVARADPCQAEAVAHARHSPALVIHGPPGTGKSQTIANVIGDHLARGQRVLFVADKRTALDVVKYRLDSMKLGALCGVIHDPQRDRRELYLGIRARLETLAQDPVLIDPAAQLVEVNKRLDELHRELKAYFDRLHGQPGGRQSFHELCGHWLSLREQTGIELPATEGFDEPLLETHRVDAEEILRRARQARWPDNPFRDRVRMPLTQWLSTTSAQIRAGLERALPLAEQIDSARRAGMVPLDPRIPARDQARARAALADRLERAAARALAPIASRLATDPNWQTWREEAGRLSQQGDELRHPLDRELVLQLDAAVPALGDCTRHLQALEQWRAIENSWRRFFAFGPRRDARRALQPLALPLAPDTLARAASFYRGLRARHLWNDLRSRMLGCAAGGLPPDNVLLELHDGLPDLLAARETAADPANGPVQDGALSALQGSVTDAFLTELRLSAQRASALDELEGALANTGLFGTEALAALSREWRRHEAAAPICSEFISHADTLEEVVRLVDRLDALPAPARAALADVAARGLSWADAEPALRAAIKAREIRARLGEDETLARLDTQRVESAFAEMMQRTREKEELVRQVILHRWQQLWRERLLAGTGSRLNALGAALRQRLFVRGQRAMKLRQMIQTGAEIPGRDPLFDLCPVWMASPATVAQIFPRQPLFDTVIFDEASQCRLEEALPVLLRGRRVVIAGDPKQLPPTRFFEQSLAESDAISAESIEEVFVQQQAEAEDLLSAALNLNVQEAFLDVHYRSRNEALIGYSNRSFYSNRLQPVPGHPQQKALAPPIRLVRVDGVYRERGNTAEAQAAAKLVAKLLDSPAPPSIGLACFNLNQRDLILDALEELAAADSKFAERLEKARHRQGPDSFEGLFVKNLENVQGDERDHIIISTTFGPDPEGKFRRNFGVLSQQGGERRLNVLVTRAREMVHVLTSIPRGECVEPDAGETARTGRHHLYGYLRYAEQINAAFQAWQENLNTQQPDAPRRCEVAETHYPSPVAEALATSLLKHHQLGSTVYWGNDGFCVDLALTNSGPAPGITLGVLTDFTRYRKAPDPIAWEQFRTLMLSSQGWKLHRVWTPALFRDPEAAVRPLIDTHGEDGAERGPAASR